MFQEWMLGVPLIIGKKWSKDHDAREYMNAARYYEKMGKKELAEEFREKARAL